MIYDHLLRESQRYICAKFLADRLGAGNAIRINVNGNRNIMLKVSLGESESSVHCTTHERATARAIFRDSSVCPRDGNREILNLTTLRNFRIDKYEPATSDNELIRRSEFA